MTLGQTSRAKPSAFLTSICRIDLVGIETIRASEDTLSFSVICYIAGGKIELEVSDTLTRTDELRSVEVVSITFDAEFSVVAEKTIGWTWIYLEKSL